MSTTGIRPWTEESKMKTKRPLDYWISRWDRMQEYYIPDRRARFQALLSIVRSRNQEPRSILDLGCGTGTILLECLLAFPAARVVGVDYDPTLLSLARERLVDFQARLELLQVDVRQKGWTGGMVGGFDAVLSATALHWLSARELSFLYSQVFSLLQSKGLFLNADHAASPDAAVQKYWKDQMQSLRLRQEDGREPWDSFWEDYLGELGGEAEKRWKELQASRQGVEGGMPLVWHFDRLKEAGFREVECFYRFHSDAIYGGIKA